MQNIADRAGLTKGAIYGHFRSKGQLLIEVIRHLHAEWEGSEGFNETLRRHAGDLMHDPSGLPARVLELEAAVAARHDPDVAAGIAEYLAERIAVTQGDLDGLVADPETVAWVIWAVSSAFGVSDLTGIRVPDPDRVKQLMRPWVVGR